MREFLICSFRHFIWLHYQPTIEITNFVSLLMLLYYFIRSSLKQLFYMLEWKWCWGITTMRWKSVFFSTVDKLSYAVQKEYFVNETCRDSLGSSTKIDRNVAWLLLSRKYSLRSSDDAEPFAEQEFNLTLVTRILKNRVVMRVETSRTRFLPRKKEILYDENNEARCVMCCTFKHCRHIRHNSYSRESNRQEALTSIIDK